MGPLLGADEGQLAVLPVGALVPGVMQASALALGRMNVERTRLWQLRLVCSFGSFWDVAPPHGKCRRSEPRRAGMLEAERVLWGSIALLILFLLLVPSASAAIKVSDGW